MRKLLIVLSILLFAMGITSTGNTAPVLQVGDIALKLNDVTFFDIPSNLLQPDQSSPNTPAWTGSGRIWGIANITTIHKILPGGTVENPILEAVPIWSATANDLFQVRFGGMILSHT